MSRTAPKKAKRSVKSKQSGTTKSKTSGTTKSAQPNPKSRELYAFLFLTIVLAPVASAALVGSYGFVIWMYQLIAGPPGV